ncbi:RagB/SusD family nutrient uptake outer membrane protein [Pedobacter sp. MC2016-24]|uniref:RagB/SusD family nutrient uptake outer membrane protein n=1 Tax=Pedobacter sp. MC2016-24 TaxID=2780090 RepID=UPI0018821C38|nr:RagB/SusD family nutrient uptake outer membrane protein [Pedobacter sp. MC2016-24]MBE9601861.1 RagB/SusD family nutrient uptake outer membrane protein [Pedobacter sp. MC2016-24]
MKNITYLLILLSCLLCSCKQFLDIDPPKSSLVQESVYQNDETATAAILGIYSSMAGNGYAGGGNNSITAIAGLSSDELTGFSTALQEFYTNQVSLTNGTLKSLYLGTYQNVFAANAILEGLSAKSGVTPPVKSQIEGEAHFVRAFIYFYLTNLFGNIPLQLTTDYRVTRLTPLSSTDKVYSQILTDLKTAEGLLTDVYPSTEKVRPNLSAVQALLARVYLYRKDWINAEKYAGMVIAKSGKYSLPALNDVFLKNSSEAIWQLFPTANANTREGGMFILTNTPINVTLEQSFATSGFESNDKRPINWIKSFSNTKGTWYHPFKYKVRSSTTVSEYSMVLRLAEQYLIRAEARAKQNDLDGSIADLDKIRGRAGLLLIRDLNPGINQTNLLKAILKERKTELFSEWGHRWLDLKRTDQASTVLAPIKMGWQDTDVFYPLPADEINRNPNLN